MRLCRQIVYPDLFVCLWGFKVLRDVIHGHYIRRPKKGVKQVGKEGVSTPKSYSPLGVLPWKLIKFGTRVLQGSYPSVTLPYNTDPLVRPAATGDRTTNLSISTEFSSLSPLPPRPLLVSS